MDWLAKHWDDVVQIYLMLVGAASIIVSLTPTKKDNKVLDKIIRFVSTYIALNKK